MWRLGPPRGLTSTNEVTRSYNCLESVSLSRLYFYFSDSPSSSHSKALVMITCRGCNHHFYSRGYTSHLIQTTNAPCVSIYQQTLEFNLPSSPFDTSVPGSPRHGQDDNGHHSGQDDDQPEDLPVMGFEDEESELTVKVLKFPTAGGAGKPIRFNNLSAYEQYDADVCVAGNSETPWSPFASEVDWQIARWIKLHGPGCNSVSELLDVKEVCSSSGTSIHSLTLPLRFRQPSISHTKTSGN
jgi:hypothetical protein